MKMGHRRTQSEHLGSLAEDPPRVDREAPGTDSCHIQHLLRRSQLKTKEKICHVESLNTPQKGTEDKLFNFGKGSLREQIHLQLQSELMDCIPEKLKHHPSKVRKTADSQHAGRNKNKPGGQSVMKICKVKPLRDDPKESKGLKEQVKLSKGMEREVKEGREAKEWRKDPKEGRKEVKEGKKEVKEGREGKVRKLSVYEPSLVRATKHRKDISSLK